MKSENPTAHMRHKSNDSDHFNLKEVNPRQHKSVKDGQFRQDHSLFEDRVENIVKNKKKNLSEVQTA